MFRMLTLFGIYAYVLHLKMKELVLCPKNVDIFLTPSLSVKSNFNVFMNSFSPQNNTNLFKLTSTYTIRTVRFTFSIN